MRVKRVKLFLNINVFVMIFLLSSTLSAQRSAVNEKSTFQFSLVPSISTNGLHSVRYSNDVSFNILLGVSKNESAFTFSGLASIIRNNASGLQFAGLLNSVRNEGRGMTFAGLANLNFHNHRGVQFAGLFNQGKELKGVQFAGLCNIAKDIKGIQVAGLVNKARNVSGVQIAGLVNIADNSDYPIGLVNIIKNGEYGIALTHNEIGSASVTFRSGGKVMYGILGFGYNHKVDDNNFFDPGNGLSAFINLSSFVTTAGVGAHINLLPWLRINNELSGNFIIDDSDDISFMTGYSLMPAFRIGNIELFGGPSINFLQTDNLKNDGMFPKKTLWDKYSTSRMQQLHLGYQVGVQYIF